MEGRRVLKVTWDEGPNKDLNTAAIMQSLRESVSKEGATLYSTGDVTKASGHRIEASYELPFMAHAPMEPGNCDRALSRIEVRDLGAYAGAAGRA